jgi:pimeloyl-ACP methyl ester carboxylesterase
MATADANDIQIEYDTFGDPSLPAMLLIAGLGSQMITWSDEFCTHIADQGFHVIRFDNRDVGLSSKISEAGIPDIMEMVAAKMGGGVVEAPYALVDMADDAAGLLDAIGISKVHICGRSMGGMIAQEFALNHPDRTLSLTSIYSTTGNPDVPQATPEAMQPMMEPTPTERNAYIKYYVEGFRAWAGKGLPLNEEFYVDMAAKSFDRSFYPQGTARQLAAVVAQTNRKPALGKLKTPTLVVHGDEDPLVPLGAGQDTAEAIPNAELLIIEGMGHELSEMNDYWIRISAAIVDHMRKAS